VAPKELGFDIEIKYPVPTIDENDMDSWEDQNDFADRILKVIFEHAADRKIFISTFEPDLCSL